METDTSFDIWRADDVGAFYGVTRRTVERWVKNGVFLQPRRDPGGNPYWLATEVRAHAARPLASEPQQMSLQPTWGGAAWQPTVVVRGGGRR